MPVKEKAMEINDTLNFTCKMETAKHLSTTEKNLKRNICIPVKEKAMQINDMLDFT